MILVNWGSSNFRAYRVDADYRKLSEKGSKVGASTVPRGQFRQALINEVGDWIREGESKVLMSGMVGSRYGWREAPYVSIPSGIERICKGVVPLDLDDLDARIVPGLSGTDSSGTAEVMRGEETEIAGCQDLSKELTVALPGTHTKWVEVRTGRIVSFTTYMTGELYQAIRSATVLARSLSAVGDDTGFDRGVLRARESGGLQHHLFGVRSMVLSGALMEDAASSYLSGLLIGHELQNAVGESAPVHLIGDAKLCALYARARSLYGGPSTIEPEGAAIRGLVAIARRLSWR